MRVSAFTLIAVCAVLTQVTAAPPPIHFEEDSPLTAFRFGHAVPPMPSYPKDVGHELLHIPPPGEHNPVSPGGNQPTRFRHRPGCRGKKAKFTILMHRIKIKAIKIGNCFRKALGWPLIEVHYHHHHGHPHHRPKDQKNDEEAGRIRIDGGFINILPFPGVTADNHGDRAGVSDMHHDHPHHETEHKEHKHHHKHHGAFLSRLHHSLMNLGRWEGRAVAFVIGCGIGVLVRMLWVLAIVSYRAFRGHRDDGYTVVAVMEEYDSDDETVISVSKTEPPKYIYPLDEKIAVDDSN